ncbi:MAG: hypothetical protein Q9227_000439 [Pyrenula ochraceoflavens]
MSGHPDETSENVESPSTQQIEQPHIPPSPTLNGTFTNGDLEEPPLKKRRVDDQPPISKTKPRQRSPPWKRVAVEGPTSFVEDGRRKSSRTNALPLDLQPQSDTRRTRAAVQKVHDDKAQHYHKLYGKQSGRTPGSETSSTRVRPPSAGKTYARVGKDSGRINVHSKLASHSNGHQNNDRTPPPKSRHTEHHEKNSTKYLSTSPSPPELRVRSWHGGTKSPNDSPSHEAPLVNGDRSTLISNSIVTPTKPTRLQKIRLSLKMPTVAIQHPDHVVSTRRFSSFKEWLEKDEAEPRAGQGGWAPDVVEEKADERFHVLKEQRPGGLLTDEKFVGPEKQEIAKTLPEEPQQQYGHHQHLIAHAIYLRHLQEIELRRHKTQAKRLATHALDHPLHTKLQALRRLAEPHVEVTKEMIEKEQEEFQVKRYTRLMRDLQKQWDSVATEVRSQRLAEWEEDQRVRGKEHLDRLVEHHTKMLEIRQSNNDDEDDESNEDGISDAASESPETSEDDSNMSTSEESDNTEPGMADDDQTLTADELQMKYASLLDQESDAEKLDPAVSQSPNSDDTDYRLPFKGPIENGGTQSQHDTDEGTDSDDDNSSTNMSDANPRDSLLGFYQADQRASVIEKAVQENSEQQGKPDDELPDVDKVMSGTKGGHIPEPIGTTVDQDVDSSTTIAAILDEAKSPKSPQDGRVPVPSLLRATLREYQHDGLDWLVRLYEKGHNGILADEMGLGKTIQSIALLAHLAVEHQIWGPHLIVVPTSVMLNWEMEFKKFLPGFKIMTYYGTIEERKQKRRGWMDDDLWNVCITSYQLVLQDQQAFKRRQWHYLILDEAHHIKNFQSQRWQALLGFRTHSRLLLTGTPLQNHLSELWSLLFFLNANDAFTGLEEFKEAFGKFSGHILEHGRDTMDDQDKVRVLQLQTVLRPYLLRRLKADVEKQMPAKYEHVELCRLSKRQRQLYDGFMSRAQTKETLASGNYLSIMNCLMQLRKVCNHPDLFEERPITTSFAMSKPAAAEFEIKELLVRRRVLDRSNSGGLDLDFLHLAPVSHDSHSSIEILESSKLMAYVEFQKLRHEQHSRANWSMPFNGASTRDVLASLENIGRQSRMAELETCLYLESQRHKQRALYGDRFLRFIRSEAQPLLKSPNTLTLAEREVWLRNQPTPLQDIMPSLDRRSFELQPILQRFGCITPAVVAPDMTRMTLTPTGSAMVQEASPVASPNPYHEAQTRLSIAFPDKRLLQFDCGKLQRLDKLLRELQAGGHRALIFTQMTKVLNILEQFLNIHGHRYLRLDGQTKLEQRQALTERFNSDPRILAFILSSRSGGLGINLTGADTVIFYDLDWNPAMDKQCQDRCHRIGQTRDVHIYRFVSEHTIESNILKKANQKRMLDDVVIQEGEFTTDYFNKLSVRDMVGDDAISSGDGDEHLPGLDRVFGAAKGGIGAAFSQVEDREDAEAARLAEKEDARHTDAADFDERTLVRADKSATPRTPGDPLTPGGVGGGDPGEEGEGEDEDERHIDTYLIRAMKWLLKDEPVVPLDKRKKAKKAAKKGMEHRVPRRQR